MGLRTKLYLLILPLILVVVLLSGVLSSMTARSVLTPMATRLLAYKAEQLRDFGFSEWETIASLQFEDNRGIIEAAQESFQSYATSLLRTESELIVVIDEHADLVVAIGADVPSYTGSIEEPETGWFSGSLLGEQRVGVVFWFEPYGWRVAVTELHSVFFTEDQAIFRTHIVISLIALFGTTVLVWLFGGYLIRPIERLSTAILDVETTGDLSRRVVIEFADEVGLLGVEFNRMISSLEENHTKLEKAVQAESTARELAVSREEETLFLLGRVSEYRDKETADHLERIGRLSGFMCRHLGYTMEETDLIRRASALHDIGKIAIPDRILLKSGKLTNEEHRVMQNHTVIGHQLLNESKSAYLVKGAEIALSHHEKWDGSGYPGGIAGTNIPRSGRIVAVVDVFDALMSERPYKKAWTLEAARDVIVEGRGKHFDPDLVDIFIEHFEELCQLVFR